MTSQRACPGNRSAFPAASRISLTLWASAMAAASGPESEILLGAVLTTEEKKRLRKTMEAMWPFHLSEFDLVINTRLREGNQCGLAWDMVDCKARMPNIPRTKNEESLRVPINDAALAALTLYETGRPQGAGVPVGANR
jgi:integrase